MPFAAFDLHKKEVEAIVLSNSGKVLHRERFATTREALLDFANRHLNPQTRLAMEATSNTWPIVDLLRPFVHSITVSNPMKTRVIAESRIKTDKVDAFILAQLLRLDFLPSVWYPDPATQSLRRRSTLRTALVNDRTQIKNRIHSILHHRIVPVPPGDLFSKSNLDWLTKLELDPDGRSGLDLQLRLLAQIEIEIDRLSQQLAAHAWTCPAVQLLMTMPGVDFIVAESLVAAFGDLSRFTSADKAASYLGLAPSTYQSGSHCYHGRITKQGNSHARFMLVEAAQSVARHPGPLGSFFRRLAKKKNRNVAIVAVARKLATIAWHMLKNNQPYRYASPDTVEAKFTRLRKLTDQPKRKSGPKPGSKSPNYGTGRRSRLIPALPALYEREGLPPLKPLSPGEAKMLANSGTTEFAEKIRQPRRIPKSTKATAS